MNDMIEEIDYIKAFSSNTPSKVYNISSLCIQYVNENLTKNLKAADVANALNISATHIQHTFKKETGVTLHYYIFRQKMQLAKLLLSQGQSAQSVASTLGYECYSTFYLNYMKYFQSPPSTPINKVFYGHEHHDDDNN